MYDKRKDFKEMALEFALDISNICDGVKGCHSYVDQIVRSSASIGANLSEARYAQSRADFINKLEIALKECYETEYWLELLYRKGKITEVQFAELNKTRGKLQKKLISSITTAKKRITDAN